jgi:hypothetical protein
LGGRLDQRSRARTTLLLRLIRWRLRCGTIGRPAGVTDSSKPLLTSARIIPSVAYWRFFILAMFNRPPALPLGVQNFACGLCMRHNLDMRSPAPSSIRVSAYLGTDLKKTPARIGKRFQRRTRSVRDTPARPLARQKPLADARGSELGPVFTSTCRAATVRKRPLGTFFSNLSTTSASAPAGM